MILISSISDAGRCCCKWVENRSQFRSSNAKLGLAAAPVPAPTTDPILVKRVHDRFHTVTEDDSTIAANLYSTNQTSTSGEDLATELQMAEQSAETF
jgi:hypothetical protein